MSWGYSYSGAQTATPQANARFSGSFGSQSYDASSMQEPSEPDPKDMHDDWSDAWAPSLTSSSLRSEIASNPRLANRLARLKTGSQTAASQETRAQNFAQNAQDQQNFRAETEVAGGADVRSFHERRGGHSHAANAQIVAYEAYIRNPSEILRRAGLIWNAASFARIIDGVVLRALSQTVPAAELEAALKYIHLSMPTISVQNLEPQRLSELLRACGERAAFAWANQLPEQLRARVLTTLPRIGSTALPDQVYKESAILQAALDTRMFDRGESH